MKVLIFLCLAALAAAQIPEDNLKCNFRVCGAELLDFKHFDLATIFRKYEISEFCIKNCTPPIVHEFFQSLIFGITRRIPRTCYGDDCLEVNRFVALAKCAKEKAWPLVICSKRLIDLAQIGLVAATSKQKRNTTCSIVVETTECIENILEDCGEKPFSLVKEICTDVVKLAVKHYCHPSFTGEDYTPLPTTIPPFQERMKHFTDIPTRPGPYPYPQFVKGYRKSSAPASMMSIWLNISVLGSLIMSLLVLHHP